MAAPFGLLAQQNVEAIVQQALKNLRNALMAVEQIQTWLSAYSQTDFTGPPLLLPAADVAAMFAAVADAAAISQIFRTGQPPGSYPQAVSVYVYASSVNQIVGPLG